MLNGWQNLKSIYIHWPFCPYRCSFCPFIALSEHNDFMKRYHNALSSEIENFSALVSSKLPIQTIFLGGGTPSTWPDDLLLDMFVKLKDVFSFSENAEVTIEVNPGTVRREQLEMWRKIGINRLSIGIQTLNDEVLRRLNRHQTKEEVYCLLDCALKVFKNISVDLMIGLPGVSSKEWRSLLEEVITWPITHISIYSLMVHEETKLFYERKQGLISLPHDDEVASMYEIAVNLLSGHGFEHYEVSNFAHPGYESKHNNAYWNYDVYRGFGLGACSFDGAVRRQNSKRLMDYIEKVERNEATVVFEEQLTEEQVQLEKIMLGLRTKKGVDYLQLFKGLSCQEVARTKKYIKWLKQHNFIIENDEMFRLTTKGLVVEHEIIARFFSGSN